MAPKVTTISVGQGVEMPVIGLGTWQSKAGEVGQAVKVAIDSGYRLIDCAYGYGNEAEVGQAIKEKVSEGTVTRQDLFIISKLWNTRHSPNDVKPSVQESLASLQVDYIDLYLIHWPHAFKPGGENFPRNENGDILYADIHYLDTWKALEKCVDEGLIKMIGLSNFNSRQIQDILDNGRIKPVNLQIEIHPYLSQEKLVSFCLERGISVTGYSPLGSPQRPWVTAGDKSLLDDERIKEIGQKYSKTNAQVILRWFIQRGVCALPKSVTPERIQSNLDVFDFELNAEDVDTINSFNCNQRLICPMVERDGKRVMRDGLAPYYPFQDDIEF